MHGCGNDFVITNYTTLNKDNIQLICNRHYGIGCDQLLMFNIQDDIVELLIFNQDGSVAINCGNGLRCIGLLMNILYQKDTTQVKMPDGQINKTKIIQKNTSYESLVYAELGKYTMTQLSPDIKKISIGNQHLVIEVDNITNIDIAYSKYLSTKHDANVSYVQYNGCKAIARVYERGTGETNACGTAAAAIHLARDIHDNTETEVKFISDNIIIAGNLSQSVYIVGSASLVYDGTFYFNKK